MKKHDCVGALLKNGILHEIPSGMGKTHPLSGVDIENRSDQTIWVLILEEKDVNDE